LQLTEIVTSKY